jgi:transcriptional regulator with XRE-family HTH domain
LGDLIRQRRKALGWTVTALSERVGCSPTYISKIEISHELPTFEMLETLAEILELNFKEIEFLRHKKFLYQMLQRIKPISMRREIQAKLEPIFNQYRPARKT